jgi:hypothetical protein
MRSIWAQILAYMFILMELSMYRGHCLTLFKNTSERSKIWRRGLDSSCSNPIEGSCEPDNEHYGGMKGEQLSDYCCCITPTFRFEFNTIPSLETLVTICNTLLHSVTIDMLIIYIAVTLPPQQIGMVIRPKIFPVYNVLWPAIPCFMKKRVVKLRDNTCFSINYVLRKHAVKTTHKMSP